MKKAMAGIMLTFLLFTIGSSAEAAFRCQSSNARGQAWFAISHERFDAKRAAMRACRVNSFRPGSCHVDFCNYFNRHHRHHDRFYHDGGIRIDVR